MQIGMLIANIKQRESFHSSSCPYLWVLYQIFLLRRDNAEMEKWKVEIENGKLKEKRKCRVFNVAFDKFFNVPFFISTLIFYFYFSYFNFCNFGFLHFPFRVPFSEWTHRMLKQNMYIY